MSGTETEFVNETETTAFTLWVLQTRNYIQFLITATDDDRQLFTDYRSSSVGHSNLWIN